MKKADYIVNEKLVKFNASCFEASELHKRFVDLVPHRSAGDDNVYPLDITPDHLEFVIESPDTSYHVEVFKETDMLSGVVGPLKYSEYLTRASVPYKVRVECEDTVEAIVNAVHLTFPAVNKMWEEVKALHDYAPWDI